MNARRTLVATAIALAGCAGMSEPDLAEAQYGRITKVVPVIIESDKARYRLDGPYKLRFSWTLENPDKRIAAVEKLLRRLGAEDVAAAAA